MTESTSSGTLQPRKSRMMLWCFVMVVLLLLAVMLGMRYLLSPLLLLPQNLEQTVATQETATIMTRLDVLESRLEALESRAPSGEMDLSSLDARLTALEQASKPVDIVAQNPGVPDAVIAQIQQQLDAVKGSEQHALRRVLAVDAWKQAVRAGRPFAAEQEHLLALAPELAERLQPLKEAAATGIATLTQLQEQFARAIDPALHPAPAKETVMSNLRSLVRIRKVGEAQPGASDEAVLARAEAKLARGELPAALQEVAGLSPPAAAAFTIWKERATRYQYAQTSIEGVEAALPAGTTE